MEGDDVEYVEASAGASATYPVQCSSLRKNGFVMIKGRPCKIMEMSTSKTGKHGHAKVKVLIYFSSFLSPSLPLTHTHTHTHISLIFFFLCFTLSKGNPLSFC